LRLPRGRPQGLPLQFPAGRFGLPTPGRPSVGGAAGACSQGPLSLPGPAGFLTPSPPPAGGGVRPALPAGSPGPSWPTPPDRRLCGGLCPPDGYL